MNEYEQKQEARRERLEARAARKRAQANASIDSGRQRLAAIPFGQPILVGHYSEKRDRNYRAKACGAMERGFRMMDEAAELESRAASVGTAGISSDDPDAIQKLQEQLDERKATQAKMANANKLVRKKDRQGLLDAGWPASVVEQWLTVPSWGGKFRAFEPYELSNNNAQIKRIEGRIAQLQRASEREYQVIEKAGVKAIQNPEINRVQLIFPGKPSYEVRKLLKGRGFRWAPSEGAWQRQLTNSAIWAAKDVLAQLEGMDEPELG